MVRPFWRHIVGTEKFPPPGGGWPRRGRERNAGGDVLVLNTSRLFPLFCLASSLRVCLICCADFQIIARIPLPTRYFLACARAGHLLPGRRDWWWPVAGTSEFMRVVMEAVGGGSAARPTIFMKNERCKSVATLIFGYQGCLPSASMLR